MDIISLESAIKEIHEKVDDMEDPEYILKIFKIVCWEYSKLVGNKIILKDREIK